MATKIDADNIEGYMDRAKRAWGRGNYALATFYYELIDNAPQRDRERLSYRDMDDMRMRLADYAEVILLTESASDALYYHQNLDESDQFVRRAAGRVTLPKLSELDGQIQNLKTKFDRFRKLLADRDWDGVQEIARQLKADFPNNDVIQAALMLAKDVRMLEKAVQEVEAAQYSAQKLLEQWDDAVLAEVLTAFRSGREVFARLKERIKNPPTRGFDYGAFLVKRMDALNTGARKIRMAIEHAVASATYHSLLHADFKGARKRLSTDYILEGAQRLKGLRINERDLAKFNKLEGKVAKIVETYGTRDEWESLPVVYDPGEAMPPLLDIMESYVDTIGKAYVIVRRKIEDFEQKHDWDNALNVCAILARVFVCEDVLCTLQGEDEGTVLRKLKCCNEPQCPLRAEGARACPPEACGNKRISPGLAKKLDRCFTCRKATVRLRDELQRYLSRKKFGAAIRLLTKKGDMLLTQGEAKKLKTGVQAAHAKQRKKIMVIGTLVAVALLVGTGVGAYFVYTNFMT